jgi:hypothetical protein
LKPPIFIILSCGLSLATAHGSTTPDPHHLQPNAPRTVIVSEAETPPVIRAGLLQSTLILLPAEEKIATVFGGDTVDWVFDGGHVASRFISTKPKVANSTTDIHIISDHGNEYKLQLREVSGDDDPHFDSKIFIAPGDQSAKDKLAAMPVFVRQSKTRGRRCKSLPGCRAEGRGDQSGDIPQPISRKPPLRLCLGPGQGEGSRASTDLARRQVTYLRGQFQETPALYELKDKKGSLINFDYNNGLYTVPKELDHGYLAIGKEKVEFSRVEGRN